MSPERFAIDVVQRDRFQFDVEFDDDAWPSVRLDEPKPLGDGAGPNAVRLLSAAVGNCLAASLLFCLERAHLPVAGVHARVEGVLDRNDEGRLRVAALEVTLVPSVEGESGSRYERCLEIFEDYCVVTQSVREGIDVEVRVERGGHELVGAGEGGDVG